MALDMEQKKIRAAAYLGQIRRLNARIKNKLQEKEQIMELATNVTPTLSDMPRGSGVADKVGNAGTKLAKVETEINQIIDQLIDTRAEIIELLETLPSDEYTVLHNFFVLGQTIETIAENMEPREKTARQIYRIKSKGLKHVQAILEQRDQIRE